MQDGPYADTKEQLGGFTVLELPSLDAALDWAARCPAASIGAVEVRPLATEYQAKSHGMSGSRRRTSIGPSSGWPASPTAVWWPIFPRIRGIWPAPRMR